MSYRNHIEAINKSTGEKVLYKQIFGNNNTLVGIKEFVLEHFGKDDFDTDDWGYYKGAGKPADERDFSADIKPLVIKDGIVLNDYIKMLYRTDVLELRRCNDDRSLEIRKDIPEAYNADWLVDQTFIARYGEQAVDFVKDLLNRNIIGFGYINRKVYFYLEPSFELHIEGY